MPAKKYFDMLRDEKKFILVLNTTVECNLKCTYCYEPRGDVEGKSMDFEIAKDAIRHYANVEDGHDRIEIQFFGGEPMLEFQLIKKIVEWFQSRQWRKKYIFFICSNGTILTEEMKNWLLKNRESVVLGFSIDGNKTAHDLGRSGSYDLVRENIPFITETWPAQAGKMTIYGETIPYVADSVIELEEMGIFFSANLVFEDIWGDEQNKKKLLGIYKEQLLLLVDYYLANPHLEPVRPLLARGLASIGQKDEKSPSGSERNDARFCGAGHDMVMVDVDGQRYPCHRFSNWITKRAAPTRAVNRQKEWKPAKCASCKFVSVCPTCVGFNWEVEGDESVRTTYHCEALKLEVLAAAKLNAERLERMPIEDVSQLPKVEAYRLKKSLEVIMELNESGISLD